MTNDIQALAKTIVFTFSDASRGMDIHEWEEKLLSRYPVIQKDVTTVQLWIQEAVAAERLQCCRDVCPACADGVRSEFRERPDSGIKNYAPTWVHLWGSGVWTVCATAGIHERARAEEEE